MTIGEVVAEGERALASTSSSARLDSELLLTHVLACSRTALIVRFRDLCPESACSSFHDLLTRRLRGEPIAYIVGEREFWDLSFEVSSHVLVPRPESELIIEQGLLALAGIKAPKIVDLGTGSGCLAVSLVKELLRRGARNPSCVAVDCSPEALAIAERNARRHGVDAYITCVQSDWFSRAERFTPPYDLIVANPPYIDPAEETPVELSFEPRGALFAEEGGLKDVMRILKDSLPMLAPQGVLLCEVGAGKRAVLRVLIEELALALHISYLGDDSFADRFTVLRATRKL